MSYLATKIVERPKCGWVVQIQTDRHRPSRGLYDGPPGSLPKKMSVVESGESVLVLETYTGKAYSDFWVKCLTAKGEIGWLPAGFVSLPRLGAEEEDC